MKKSDLKILLVDDEPDIVEILSYNLGKEGYQIFSASNGKEALEKANSIEPHLIILDVMMPVMGGIETCEALRKENKYQETIILFLSARAEDYSHLAAFEVGADDYVNKPIKPKMLNSKVNALLRRFIKSESITALTFGELVINFEEYNVFLKDKKISFASLN